MVSWLPVAAVSPWQPLHVQDWRSCTLWKVLAWYNALQRSTFRLGSVQHSVTVMVAGPVVGGASGAADGEGSCAK